jgi:Kef-type K+ transport system membrane component KefB
MGTILFIPIFFIVTGFMIDQFALIHSISQDYLLGAGIIGPLIAGKWVGAES